VAGYFIDGISHPLKSLEPLARLTPCYYYQGAHIMTAPVNWTWLGGLTPLSALFLLAGWWRVQRRDIRVSGEGAWSLSLLRRHP
jgi:hypothetical protein